MLNESIQATETVNQKILQDEYGNFFRVLIAIKNEITRDPKRWQQNRGYFEVDFNNILDQL